MTWTEALDYALDQLTMKHDSMSGDWSEGEDEFDEVTAAIETLREMRDRIAA